MNIIKGETMQKTLTKGRKKFSKTQKRLIFRGIFAFAFVLIFVFAPFVTDKDPIKFNLRDRTSPPGAVLQDGNKSILGTDQIGRDMFTRILYGGRLSLLIAFSAVAVAGVSGTILGLLSGYFGGIFDEAIMRIGDIQLAFPPILLALAITSVIGPSVTNIIITLGITRWVSYARLVRGNVLSAREDDYVLAAKNYGARAWMIISKHILPNVMTPVIILASLHVGQMIIYESALSFLGLGIQPPTASWGGMISDGREYLNTAWWITTFSGAAIALTVMILGYLGDAIRDALDPLFTEY